METHRKILFAILICTTAVLSACGSGGSSSSPPGNSNPASDTSPPSVPSDVTATTVSSTQIGLSWTASVDDTAVAGYRIFRDGSDSLLNDVGVTTASDTGLNFFTEHCYEISAYDAAGNESEKSVQVCATTKVSGKLPDTGQIDGYTTTSGEDADYSINQPSYSATGMISGKDAAIKDNITGLMWQQEDDYIQYNWYEAMGITHATHNPDGSTNACGLTINGYTDWRVPTKQELVRIVNYNNASPAIDDTVFTLTQSFVYWTSTPYQTTTNQAWYVNFDTGASQYTHKSNKLGYVRCVRGGQIPNDFANMRSDGTVTDNVTGLIWQQSDDNVEKTWDNALTYCEILQLAGYSDWRLPNKIELESIADESTYNPAIDRIFTGTKPANYWTSTTFTPYPDTAWYGSFRYGNFPGGAHKSHLNYARCVRGGQ